MGKLIFTFFLFTVMIISTITAQSVFEKNFTAYTTVDGLSDNNVMGIAQDARGYIWLSTSFGLNRYDGSRFIQYHSTGDSLSPASEEINRITWLDKERIALHTAGLHIINTKTGVRKNVYIPYKNKQYQYKFNKIERVAGDSNGNMYVLGRSGFYVFDKKYKLLFRFDYHSEKGLATEHFHFGTDLVQLDEQRILVVGGSRFYIYSKQKKELKQLQKAEEPLLDEFIDRVSNSRYFQLKPGQIVITKPGTDTVIYINIQTKKKVISKISQPSFPGNIHWRTRIIPVNDSSFYLTGQYSGFYQAALNPQTGVIRFLPEKQLDSYLCNDLLLDQNGTLWAATTKGILKKDDALSVVQSAKLPAELEAQIPNFRFDAVTTTNKKVYAGARSNNGLLIYDKETFTFEKNLLFTFSEKSNSVHELEQLNHTNILLGTNDPLLMYNEATAKVTKINPPQWGSGNWTNSLFTDSRANIWISSAIIYRYNIQQQQFTIVPVTIPMTAQPTAIREDVDGNIWMAGHGIIRYNTKTNQFDEKIDSFPYIKIPDKQVTALCIDRQNTMWFGSVNNGLIGYSINSKTFKHFTRTDGLPDDNISSLFSIGNRIWIACYSGIACLALDNMKITSFGKDEGFPDAPVLQSSDFYYDNAATQLYIGFYNTLVRFNPFTLRVNKKHPSVFIERITTGSSASSIYLPGNSITTSWKENDITLTIGSINFYDGRNQNYAYRFANRTDTLWKDLGNKESFTISNLSPGTHRIQVKLFSINNRWPAEIKEFVIDVTPPVWQTTWFRVLAFILLSSLLFTFIRWRTNFIRKKEMEKTQIEKLKADDFKNRLELEQISNYFSSSLTDKKTVDEVLWDVAQNLIGRMNYVDCMIYLWNDDKTKMIQKASYGPKGKPEFIQQQVFDVLPGQGVVGYVMQTMQPVLIKDTRKDPRYRIDEMHRLSEICVPVIHNNELLGIIDSEHPLENYFTERDTKILTTIATLVGNKLKQLESEEILEVKEKELSTINEQLAEAKLSALQAQMNPHFVFNALNSIKRLVLDGDNDKASRYLSKFALMIRMTLNHSREAFVTLHENIEYIHTYLDMEQLRFRDSFQWAISVADDIDTTDVQIPSLMIQPLVENAIWHGLLPSTENKNLSIHFSKNDDMFYCTIEDNGVGINHSEKLKQQNLQHHRSAGLENIRKRIQIINEKYGIHCSLTITDLKESSKDRKGTRAVLQYQNINT